MNSQDVHLSLKGTSITKEEFKAGSNKTTSDHEYLSDAYRNFIDSKSKDSDDKELYSKINEMCTEFFATFFNTLKMQVKIQDE